jgi:hypothetical protein
MQGWAAEHRRPLSQPDDRCRLLHYIGRALDGAPKET